MPPSIPAAIGSDPDPLWYKDSVIYQVHVRAFSDSNGDGIGDFRGLRRKLDYLHNLGVDTLWLLPFYPSPLRDDGYDTADYTAVHPDYGTLGDFRSFLREAHRRGLRVVTELVLNHTSDQHPWFQRARRARRGSRHRDYYVWNDTPDRYQEARIIFKDFESSNWSWDPVAGAYYWHRFYSHQPDLNFDNPEVRGKMLQVVDFWLQMGVDGLRLDAVPYLFERDGTGCENLPETHEFLRELRRHVDRKFPSRMLLAEANQWPEDAVSYFGAGDECHMAFHFPVMPRLFMAIRMEDRYPVFDILQHTPAIPETSQWALFLRNHDELTLEMVTDEDRDYMYRVYASDPRARINLGIRRRLAPLLGNDRNRIQLMNALLFSLPGTPIVYYGDEIGMGDNIYLGDRNGVRTPMQWSADRNAGFSAANPQQLYLPVNIGPEYHYEAVNVETQQNNPNSFLWWIKRLIALRRRYRAFGRGSLEFLHPENRKALAFLRRLDDDCLLVVANLSRYVQCVELDLSEFRGRTPVELFGNNPFPRIQRRPYFLTLSPHAFYWFVLERNHQVRQERHRSVRPRRSTRPISGFSALKVRDSWTGILQRGGRGDLVRVLPRFLAGCRWFGGKAKTIESIRILEALQVPRLSPGVHILMVEVAYKEGEPEVYLLPLSFAAGEEGDRMAAVRPQSVVASLRVETGEGPLQGFLYDCLQEERVAAAMLEMVARRRRIRGRGGELCGLATAHLRRLTAADESPPPPAPLRGEQSNTSVLFGDRFIMKSFRRLEEGTNPDLEIGRFLSRGAGFPHVPRVLGALEFRRRRGAMTIGMVQEYVPNEGDAWKFTLDAVDHFFDRALASPDAAAGTRERGFRLEQIDHDPSQPEQDLVGTYLPAAALLGQRTAELHLALASQPGNPDFVPEPFPIHYRQSVYQSIRSLTRESLDLLRRGRRRLHPQARCEADRVLSLANRLQSTCRTILDCDIRSRRIRGHGDYHLGQVLWTGKDFVIIDFEGEPARSLGERRLKRSAVRDVAGMLRSFHYASVFVLILGRRFRSEDRTRLESFGRLWYRLVAGTFLKSYLERAAAAVFVPPTLKELITLLRLFLLEKALYEIGYELNNRPGWVRVPLQGILDLLDPEPSPDEA